MRRAASSSQCQRRHCDEGHDRLVSTATLVAMRDNANLLAKVVELQRELDTARRRLGWVAYATSEGYPVSFHGASYVPALAITNALGLTDDVRYITVKDAA